MTLAVIGGVALFVGLFALGHFLRRTIAPIEGQTRAVELIQRDPQYRVAIRKQFFDRCAAVQSKETQVANLERELETAKGERRVQLEGAITAQLNSRAELIAEYNAAASDDFTRGVFRDLSLPYQLDPGRERTVCGS